jgi:putative ABC transport system permease protein
VSFRAQITNIFRRGSLSGGLRLIAWLESLRADTIFGWRQLRKNKLASAAAILSLALAIGACTSAFRLIDAVLLRPLPVTAPERLYALYREGFGADGRARKGESYEYPVFRQMRTAAKNQAELIAVSHATRMDLTYGSDQDMEKAQRQYVSGWMFNSFGLRPALGRLFTEDDDLKPRTHPYGVLSHDYWRSRFGRDPGVIGHTFRTGNHVYEIIGVAEEGFTGTEPGTMIDVFVPTMMHAGVTKPDWSWFRTLVQLKPGIAAESVRNTLYSPFLAFQQERAKSFSGVPKERIDKFLSETLLLEPAPAGVSAMQQDNRRPLWVLSILVALVLLITCANVANLMTAQAAAREKEMALRLSIGAARLRLVQLVLVESALISLLAAAAGGVFAWWAAPFVVGMIGPQDNPARLALSWDWRVVGFGSLLTLAVTFLFGLMPALRASGVKPMTALKGGEDPHSRRRVMHVLIAVQAAFCFIVLFAAGLFIATFDRLSNQPTGFSGDRVLALDMVSQRRQPPAFWNQLAQHLQTIQGVEAAAITGWPLLDGNGWNGYVSIDGAPPIGVLAYFLSVSPGWTNVMKIPVIAGRDFRANDAFPGPAIVNESFARQYFNGQNPIGRSFEKPEAEGRRTRFVVVGLVRDARYRNMREPFTPTAYVPFDSIDSKGAAQPKDSGTLLVRTSIANPALLAPILRHEVSRVRPEFRVSNIRTQNSINQRHTVRERLLAMLALFFAIVAVILCGVGLYSVLNYSVLQRRREIGIRIAIGASPGDIARGVTMNAFSAVLAGAFVGHLLGLSSARYIETLLYDVKPTELTMLVLPSAAILTAALLSALPAVVRAVKLDPATMLRSE